MIGVPGRTQAPSGYPADERIHHEDIEGEEGKPGGTAGHVITAEHAPMEPTQQVSGFERNYHLIVQSFTGVSTSVSIRSGSNDGSSFAFCRQLAQHSTQSAVTFPFMWVQR
jgi:hypothetical protein